jgi:cyclophilin family peptidyl-prolyl cis-trans isomerase
MAAADTSRPIESSPAPHVRLETSHGDILVKLDRAAAPRTVENFIQYVLDKHYDGTVFHRVIPGFMIQGGGMTAELKPKPTRPAIPNEASDALANARGTVAMARTSNPDSATSQFFINHADNDFLNYSGPANPGYAAFGQVVEGMDVVDRIAEVKTHTVGAYQDVPAEPVVIRKAEVVPEEEL